MRHMMPKEILDAVDLQPQYRTFSDSGLHVATGAAASRCVRVRCVPSNKEDWYCHATCEHEHSHYHKGHSSGPNGCVSDELERGKSRSAMETNCLQSRARAKVVGALTTSTTRSRRLFHDHTPAAVTHLVFAFSCKKSANIF